MCTEKKLSKISEDINFPNTITFPDTYAVQY